MKSVTRVSMLICIGALLLWIVPSLFFTTIELGTVGVRQSAVSGVSKDDLAPGWRLRVPGVHKVIVLPSTYMFLDYLSDEGGQQALQIRTKDNNIVDLDVTVPVRIRHGQAHALVEAGNHMPDVGGFRYQRLARETTVSVLREQLAELDSVGFYSTARRLEVSDATLKVLNAALANLHLEAESVLIRAVRFRTEYESQLQQIQLNEQNKLLDQARERVAAQQQELDSYEQGTRALVAAREQDWLKRQADLERAYQVGFLDIPEEDNTPGAARRALDALSDEDRAAIQQAISETIAADDPEKVTEAYLLGIKNIEAETREYGRRVQAEAEAIAARLEAEGEAKVAAVRGAFETRINALLSSPSGRAYVAWKSADNVTFDKELVFSSRDGIPSLLRLRDFALQFMGSR
ncbi:SPFH domain-containing protein [Haliangium sp.]|uniref:SPFH domain-containing protein n=1 Tax=Haliangium sp. TaxID=2663208 RepID=UPI003D0E818C